MSKTKPSAKLAIQLWVRSAGRCQYRGCQETLYRDDLTQAKMLSGYMAHIIADQPSGPRGDPLLSPQLASDITNLMLMCPQHHKMIDVDDVLGHPVERLRIMKREHEERIERILRELPTHQTEVLVYTAAVGGDLKTTSVADEDIAAAISGRRYPARERPTHINANADSLPHHDIDAWKDARRRLEAQVKSFLDAHSPSHISVFAFAPIPLLVALGRALGDARAVDVFQRHRSGTWAWPDPDGAPARFDPDYPEVESEAREVAFKVEVSTPISDEQILAVLGRRLPTYRIGLEQTMYDAVASPQTVTSFRATLLAMLEEICERHPSVQQVHMFASAPAGIGIAIGQVHRNNFPQMTVYQATGNGSLFPALEV